MLSRSLRDRISGLIREGFGRGGAPSGNGATGQSGNGHNGHDPGVTDGRSIIPSGIEDLLPGGVIHGPHGAAFVHERLYTDLGERPEPVLARYEALCALEPDPPPGPAMVAADMARPYDPALEPRVVYDPEWQPGAAPLDLPTIVARMEWPERGLFRRFGFRKMLFLDLETCGLTACPVFLAGVCLIGENDLVLRQIFARDYAEERALIHEMARLIGEADFLVSFNGKSFDVPFLRDRAAHHRMPFPSSAPHLDLLWLARRRWKHTLPDCKLKTLEWRVLRRRRSGDVGGSDIPGLYHHFVQGGEAHRLVPIFHHNMLDVVAMVELLPALFDPDAAVY
ncbi:MAG TPA: ribonuclease H-like domain-containing protein [Candidatus Eisenbacteria bacterium]|nr:ribonuclease H-like domain-containing protein [Candidatus Eisenbacteria bacterium]